VGDLAFGLKIRITPKMKTVFNFRRERIIEEEELVKGRKLKFD